jgi:hypothetical protein
MGGNPAETQQRSFTIKWGQALIPGVMGSAYKEVSLSLMRA